MKKTTAILITAILNLMFISFSWAQFDFDKNNKTTVEKEKVIELEYEEPKDTIVFEFLTKFDVPKIYLQKAYYYGTKLLNACNTSKISKFNESHFSESVYRKITLDYISIICTNIKREYGEFVDMRFVEVVYNPKNNVNMLRFKCLYEKKYSQKEFRVSFNSQGKIAGIKTLRWKDQFVPQKRKYKIFAREIDQKILDSLDKILEIDIN